MLQTVGSVYFPLRDARKSDEATHEHRDDRVTALSGIVTGNTQHMHAVTKQ